MPANRLQNYTKKCSILVALSKEDLSWSQLPASSVKNLLDGGRGTMADLIIGHITLDHMYERMQEHDLARTNVVWSLWIVNCVAKSLDVTET